MRVGVDIGSTHSDAVLVTDQGKLIASAKHLTTPDILTGIHYAIEKVLKDTDPLKVKGIFIGTTHLLNALYGQKEMAKTAVIRIGTQKIQIKPALNWPASLKDYLQHIYHLESGNRYHETNQQTVHHAQLLELYHSIEKGLVEAICIVGAYSPMYEEEELQLKKEIKSRYPNIPITVSHRLGSIGFIERENASLLNTLLSKLIKEALSDLSTIVSKLSMTCPIWLIQNNGSVMTVDEAIEFPILTIASGIANSLKGASALTFLDDFIAIDVGGSTIDIGKVRKGQSREVTSSTHLLGIDAKIEMPEFISLPFGGGSIVTIENGHVNLLQTISSDIEKNAMAWGGNTWTISDSFLKLFPDSFYNPKVDVAKLDSLAVRDCENVVSHVMISIKSILEQLQEHEEELPIVLVGGGSPLLNERLFGKYKKVINPSGYHINSAIGACFATVIEVIDKVFWLNNRTKEEVVDAAVAACKQAVLEKGAKPESIQVLYVEEYPFDYLQGEILRVKTKATGELLI